MNADADADLHKRFRELREHDGAAAPAFESVLLHASTRTQHGPSRLAWTAGGLALATAVGLFLILRPPTLAFDAEAAALPAWPSQTDFLLAGAGDSSQRLSWSPSPTSVLGQPSFNRYREDR
jgi:hypothetical protein